RVPECFPTSCIVLCALHTPHVPSFPTRRSSDLPRPGRQGPGDRHALLLTAGELAGVLVAMTGHLHEVEHLHHGLGIAAALEPQRHGHVVVDGGVGQQVELLEHHADAAPTDPLLPGGAARSSPSMSTVPEVGASRWLIRRSSVDFPEPDSPTTPTISWSPMVRSTPSRAVTAERPWEKVLVTCRNSIIVLSAYRAP